jgi:hypothetical protein
MSNDLDIHDAVIIAQSEIESSIFVSLVLTQN